MRFLETFQTADFLDTLGETREDLFKELYPEGSG